MSNENANYAADKENLKDEMDDPTIPEDIDDSKVKFLNGKKGLDDQCVVEVSSDVSFTGLGKEDLLKYANDPFWVRTRMILLVIFWVGWLAMLVAAVVIIVLAPKCPERPDLKWYETDVVYQINPKSFKDSSKLDKDGKLEAGAGMGDIQGVANKIDYFQTLGVNALWLNSFFKSGDNSYEFHDVVDHKQVDEAVGTMGAFDDLKKSLKKKGMKLVVDFIPNHTGKKHEWFMKSQNNEEGFEDFYIWADGTGSGGTDPPNNWMTEYGTPAWTYDTTRDQFYYHSYLPEYPDLNLRNEEVLKNLDGVLRFWLDKGVDGFTIQGIQRLVEGNTTTADETTLGENTVDQTENLDLVKRWRSIINSYSNKPGREKALFADVVRNGNNTEDYYKAGIHVVMSHALMDVDLGACDQTCLKERLIEATSIGQPRGWMVDNGDSPRFGSRVSPALKKAWQVLHLLLPGTPFVYYGDEIAMNNGVVPSNMVKDPLAVLGKTSRDPYRTPLLWTTGDNAGFCVKEATPWLPVNADYRNSSIEYNSAHLVGYTMLNSFKDLVSLRSEESFQFGNIEIDTLHDNILYFTRQAKGFPGFLVAINRGAMTAGFSSIAKTLTLRYDSSGSGNVGQTYNTAEAPIGFSDGEVYVFEF